MASYTELQRKFYIEAKQVQHRSVPLVDLYIL